MPLFGISWPDWARLIQSPPQLILSILVVGGAALLGGLLLGFGTRAFAAFVWRDLSSAAVLRIRVIGGIASAILAYSYLGTGDGFGWGPGPGGLPGSGLGIGDIAKNGEPTKPALGSQPSDTRPAPAPSPNTLKVLVLGSDSNPLPDATKQQFFALPDDPSPKALTVDEVMERVMALKTQGKIERVRLLVSRKYTLLAKTPAVQLRERVRSDAKLPFDQPPGDEMLSDKVITYEPK